MFGWMKLNYHKMICARGVNGRQGRKKFNIIILLINMRDLKYVHEQHHNANGIKINFIIRWIWQCNYRGGRLHFSYTPQVSRGQRDTCKNSRPLTHWRWCVNREDIFLLKLVQQTEIVTLWNGHFSDCRAHFIILILGFCFE